MSTFLAAVIQLNSQPDLQHNLEVIGKKVEQAYRMGARFIGLPENFAFLGDEEEKHHQAEVISKAVQDQIPKWSVKYGVYILAGGFPVRSGSGKVYNRVIMTGPSGGILGQYDKIHLFDVNLSEEESYKESELVEAGRFEAVVCDSGPGLVVTDNRDNTDDAKKEQKTGLEKGGARFGLSVCYDVRFPELYRKLAGLNADILCVPSAFTRPTGKAHWEILLRARAIENSAYVIAPAQTGQHGGRRKTYGHSLIIDPWGRVLADAGTEPGIITSEIDLHYLQVIRKKLPSLQHRVL